MKPKWRISWRTLYQLKVPAVWINFRPQQYTCITCQTAETGLLHLLKVPTNASASRCMSSISADHYDVVISGGGMVGFAMASALGHNKKMSASRILLLESAPDKCTTDFPNSYKESPYSNRVCAIAPSSVELLKTLGAWELVESVRAKPFTNMQVWESESDSHINFGDGQTPVATIVENDVLLQSLKHTLPSSVEVRYSTPVESYTLPTDEKSLPTLNLKDGSTISTCLLIGSDGASSLVRKTMGVQYLSWNYERSAVVATLQMQTEEGDRNDTAWQKFLPSGPIALLPLSKDHCSLVWSTTPSDAKALVSLKENDFLDALNNALWCDGSTSQPEWVHRLHKSVGDAIRDIGTFVTRNQSSPSGGYKRLPSTVVGVTEGSRAMFPLGYGHAVNYTTPRTVLIGDAAHRIHPLAGQGVNLGFGDVSKLAEVVARAVSQGQHHGSSRYLRQYESVRQLHNLSTMTAVDSLHRLYSSTLPPLVLLRALGLSAVDAVGPLKERIMAHAKG